MTLTLHRVLFTVFPSRASKIVTKKFVKAIFFLSFIFYANFQGYLTAFTTCYILSLILALSPLLGTIFIPQYLTWGYDTEKPYSLDVVYM